MEIKSPIASFNNLLEDGMGSLELIDSMGSDNTIVSSARISYLGESKGEEQDKKLIRYMVENGHTSPFEHVIFQFKIKCPLFVARQWQRHRTWSFNEVSRRYTSENIEFYIPETLRFQDTKNKQSSSGEITHLTEVPYQHYPHGTSTNWKFTLETDTPYSLPVSYYFATHTEQCLSFYNSMIDAGVSREQARMVLPQNMYTEFYGTVDLHNLMHFIRLREDPHAQKEIQVYAKAMKECIRTIVPWTYEVVYGDK